MRTLIAVLIGVGLLFLLAYAYEKYIVQSPPAALIELVTKSDPAPPLPLGEVAPLDVPQGFTATIFSREVKGARVMTRDPKGTMLVSQTSEGRVVALPDFNQDALSDQTVIVLEGLKQPHGILVLCSGDAVSSESASQSDCVLYVAETGELKSYEYDADTMKAKYIETLTTFPTGDGHYTRTLLKHPTENALLISVGSSCNVCEEEDARRATVLSYDLDTKQMDTVATGLRNTVFMTVDPKTQKVWGTDNGRDLIGNDIPPDEVNIIEDGKNYGWPICYGRNIHDTDFDKKQYFRDPCADSVQPKIELQAHSAALGIAFIPESGWPEDMRGDVLIAYHGSWNRTPPTGYKVVRFDLDDARNVTSGPIDFMTGFLTTTDTDDAIGRPAGVLAEAGVVYISDDRVGAIYRVAPAQ